MMWVTGNWRWLTLNLFALAVMTGLLWQTLTVDQFNPNYDGLLISTGKWALRFLLLSLSMTPLNTLLGWRSAIKLRKPAGLWAFAFVVAHFVLNVIGLGENWLRAPIDDYIAALGVIGLSILLAMAATSTRRAMKRMGRWWKRLHRMVYAVGIIAVSHALLETTNKRVAGYEPQVGVEIGLYLVILIVLLAVRIPTVRSGLANFKHRRPMPGHLRLLIRKE